MFPAFRSRSGDADTSEDAFPCAKVAVAVLVELGIHNPLAAEIGQNKETEMVLSKRFLDRLPANYPLEKPWLWFALSGWCWRQATELSVARRQAHSLIGLGPILPMRFCPRKVRQLVSSWPRLTKNSCEIGNIEYDILNSHA